MVQKDGRDCLPGIQSLRLLTNNLLYPIKKSRPESETAESGKSDKGLHCHSVRIVGCRITIWATSSEFRTYRLCERPRSLARTSAARSYKQWVKRNLQTESQNPGGLAPLNDWTCAVKICHDNARRHKLAWCGPYGTLVKPDIHSRFYKCLHFSEFYGILCTALWLGLGSNPHTLYWSQIRNLGLGSNSLALYWSQLHKSDMQSTALPGQATCAHNVCEGMLQYQ